MRDLDLDEMPVTPLEVEDLDLTGTFTSAAARRALVMELALLATADHNCRDVERAFLLELADRLDIPHGHVERSVDLAMRMQHLFEEATLLLSEA